MKTIEENEDDEENKIDREFVSDIMIHVSDLSSPTKPWEISMKWSMRVNLEFMI